MAREEYDTLVNAVSAARRSGDPLDGVTALSGAQYVEARATATRLKPIVHEKTKGNPRRIKRFLNDLSIRQNVAAKRGITLDPTAIAKLMILEAYFTDEFRTLAGWLSNNSLRDNIRELERQAGTAGEIESGEPASPPDADVAALRTEGDPDGVSELVHASLETAPGLLVEGDHLDHLCGSSRNGWLG